MSADDLASSGLLPKIVKAAEGYYDATLAADGIVGDRDSSANQKILQKQQKSAEKLYSELSAATDTNEDVLTLSEKASRIATTAGEGRAKISQAGWPRVFGMLVVSSFAALILFAIIFNAASPEVIAEEKRRKEEAANA